MNTMTEAQAPRRRDHADRRRAPALRSVDARDGLPPPRRVVQHRQEGRALRAPLLPRGARAAALLSGRRRDPCRDAGRPRQRRRTQRRRARCAARRRLRAVHVDRLPGRARRGRLLPGLPVALRLLPQPASHRRRAATTSATSRASSTGSHRAADCSTPSCSPAASRRRRPSSPPRSRRCARWASRSACTPAARIRGGSREVLPQRRLGRPRRQGAASRDYAAVTGVARQRHRRAREPRSRAARPASRYEVRTTVHPASTPPDALERLARELADARRRCAGSCSRFARRAARTRRWSPRRPTGVALDDALLARLSAHVPIIEVRG